MLIKLLPIYIFNKIKFAKIRELFVKIVAHKSIDSYD